MAPAARLAVRRSLAAPSDVTDLIRASITKNHMHDKNTLHVHFFKQRIIFQPSQFFFSTVLSNSTVRPDVSILIRAEKSKDIPR